MQTIVVVRRVIGQRLPSHRSESGFGSLVVYLIQIFYAMVKGTRVSLVHGISRRAHGDPLAVHGHRRDQRPVHQHLGIALTNQSAKMIHEHF